MLSGNSVEFTNEGYIGQTSEVIGSVYLCMPSGVLRLDVEKHLLPFSLTEFSFRN